MSKRTQLETAKYVFECYQKQDFSQFSEIVHKDCTWYFPGKLPWGGTYKSLEIFDFLKIIQKNLSFEFYSDNHYYESDNTVIVLCDEKFTVNATGKTVYNQLACFFEFQDGQIIRYFEHGDTGAMEAGFVLDAKN
jgi:ketosteroid isomerase-like protein